MKRLKTERGAALLEAAITVPIILLISVGIFEFGKAYQTWQVVTNASREGARLAVIEGSTDTDVRARVNAYLTAGGLAGPNTPLPDGLSDAKIPINRTIALTASGTGTLVEVDFPFHFMVLNPVIRLIAPNDDTGQGELTMVAKSVMRNE